MSCTTDGRYLVANEQDAARQAELQQQESNEQADARGDSVLQSSFESYVRTLEVDCRPILGKPFFGDVYRKHHDIDSRC